MGNQTANRLQQWRIIFILAVFLANLMCTALRNNVTYAQAGVKTDEIELYKDSLLSVKKPKYLSAYTKEDQVEKQRKEWIQNYQKTSKQETAPTVINTEDDLVAVFENAPTDGKLVEVMINNDFTLTKKVYVQRGQNIVLKNVAGQVRTISVGTRGSIHIDEKASFEFNGDNGAIDLKPSTNELHNGEIIYSGGETQLTNVRIGGFQVKTSSSGWIWEGPVIAAGLESKLNLNQGTKIVNNSVESVYTTYGNAGGVVAKQGATLVMNDGSEVAGNTIIKSNDPQYSAGGVVIHNGGHFIMNPGSRVAKNIGPFAGGIIVGDINSHYSPLKYYELSTFEMNGGEITSNKGLDRGAGICLNGNGSVTINSGEIKNNTAGQFLSTINQGACGGAISVDTGSHPAQTPEQIEYQDQNNLAKLTVNDATITGNTAMSSGGGVYINSHNVDFKKVDISKNRATYGHGGGIYLSYSNYKLTLRHALISDNRAIRGNDIPPLQSGVGGGVWICPTGSGEAHVTDGAAIFNNSAEVQGNDLSSIKSDNKYYLSVDQRLLGGGKVDWYHDRDGGQEATPVEVNKETKTIGLKAVVSAGAQLAATALASVKIHHNTAPRGGGVGSNGTLIFGDSQAQTKEIEVKKDWQVADGAKHPDAITVNLYSKDSDQPIDSLVLDANHGWTGSFKNLPSNLEYTLKEAKVDGYESTQTPITQDPNNPNLYHVTITNTPIQVPKDKKILVEKDWILHGAIKPPSVTIELLDDTSMVVSSLELNENNHWKGSFTGLDRDKQYTVREVPVEGFICQVSEMEAVPGEEQTFKVKFTNTPKSIISEDYLTRIDVIKLWEGHSGNGELPKEITINLLDDEPTSPNYGKVIDSIVIKPDENGQWHGVFNGLDNDKKYRLEEVPVAGYESSNTGLVQVPGFDNLFTITFTNKKSSGDPTPPPPPGPTPPPPVDPEEPDPTPPTPPVVDPEKPDPEPPVDPENPEETNPTPPVNPEAPSKPSVPTISGSGLATLPVFSQRAGETTTKSLPRTGDKNVVAWVVAGVLMVVLAVGILIGLRKKRMPKN